MPVKGEAVPWRVLVFAIPSIVLAIGPVVLHILDVGQVLVCAANLLMRTRMQA